ncbi:uncharacterized protein TNCV_4420211 [Trichonephila clavipes]|nr:uncharacterized protein TNCV_4420211 [Trichonephila clavipes]
MGHVILGFLKPSPLGLFVTAHAILKMASISASVLDIYVMEFGDCCNWLVIKGTVNSGFGGRWSYPMMSHLCLIGERYDDLVGQGSPSTLCREGRVSVIVYYKVHRQNRLLQLDSSTKSVSRCFAISSVLSVLNVSTLHLHAEIVEVEIEVVSPSIVPSENFAELNRTVTCMVLKANDRRTSCPCHDEFRGPRSDYVRQSWLEIHVNLQYPKTPKSISGKVPYRFVTVFIMLETGDYIYDITITSHEFMVAAIAEWYRYRIVACLVTSSSPVPLKTHRVGKRCTINLSRAETSSRWCSVVVRRGGVSSGVVHVT